MGQEAGKEPKGAGVGGGHSGMGNRKVRTCGVPRTRGWPWHAGDAVQTHRRSSVPRRVDADVRVVGSDPAHRQGGPNRGSGVYSKGSATGEDCGGGEGDPILVVPQFFVAVSLGATSNAGGGKVPHALLLEPPCLLLASTNPARGVGPAVQGGHRRRGERKVHVHGGRDIRVG